MDKSEYKMDDRIGKIDSGLLSKNEKKTSSKEEKLKRMKNNSKRDRSRSRSKQHVHENLDIDDAIRHYKKPPDYITKTIEREREKAIQKERERRKRKKIKEMEKYKIAKLEAKYGGKTGKPISIPGYTDDEKAPFPFPMKQKSRFTNEYGYTYK
jgi:type II secretory pathway component HofQ